MSKIGVISFRIMLAVAVVSALSVLRSGAVLAVSSQSLISLTNAQRSVQGLPALTWNGALSQSALLKAQDMCAKNYWAHNSPDGLTPWTFMSRAGYPYVAAGENLAKNFTADEAVVSAWMASPGHRANILSTQYAEIGIGSMPCTLQGQATTVIVAHYGRTAARAAAPTPSKPAVTPQQKTPPVAPSRAPQQQPAAPKLVAAEAIPAPEVKPAQSEAPKPQLIKKEKPRYIQLLEHITACTSGQLSVRCLAQAFNVKHG